MKTCTITVEGKGIFPVDMLRWDQAAPVYPNDAANILEPRARRTVRLNCYVRSATNARWESFGWNVIETEYHND
jgi:hypothetical protein